jgi:hypothetical protein
VIDASVDAAFEIAPVVIEGPIRKSDLDDATKAILKAQDRKVLKAVEHAVDTKINETREN